jgi:hypothetical protein
MSNVIHFIGLDVHKESGGCNPRSRRAGSGQSYAWRLGGVVILNSVNPERPEQPHQ